MREVRASEAKAGLSRLLDEVARGETIVITRHGRRIARIVPDQDARQSRSREALENINKLGKQIRQEHGRTTTKEILAWRHEGHRY